MKIIKTIKENFSSLTIRQKISFFLAIGIVFVVILATLINWHLTSTRISQELTTLSDEAKSELLNRSSIHGYKMLQSFWRVNLTFTWLSNTFLAISAVIFALKMKNHKVQQTFFLSIIYISITFLIYWTLIFVPELKEFKPLYFFNTFIIHAVSPILGFVILIINRKEIQISKRTVYLSVITMLGYYFFALITFFMSTPIYDQLKDVELKNGNRLTKELDMTIYGFLNFREPLFYKGGNVSIVCLLNLVIFGVGFVLTPAIGYLWVKTLRIKFATKTSQKVDWIRR
ncbi:MAGa3780 family membrane protein [Mycoplasma sp. 4079]|uniref:CHASE3 domain-containing protein n=1 Tax=Mycoplasma sp. 4079 TaxID=3398615 RepID=UPI0039FC7573